MSWWRSFLVHLLLAPIMPVLGWGFVTHALINRRAWRKAKASGKLPNVLASDAARHRFEAAGSLPDTISLYTLTSRDRTFDPLHNMHMVGGKRVPLFGLALLDAALEHWGPTVAVSAYGWCAHQLADSTAHYKGGFCTSLPTFRPAMGSYRPGAAGTARRRAADKVLADVDHGLVELLADAASAAAGHADPPLGDPDIDLPPDAVQQAWDAVGYAPIGIGQKWEALEAEFRSMLAAEVGLARALSRYEPGEQPVASAMETYYRDDGALKGYTSAVDAAVDLVADLLSTDQQVLRQEGRGRRLVPAAPAGELPVIGLPTGSGTLQYRLFAALSPHLNLLGARAPGVVLNGARGLLRASDATLVYRALLPFVETLRDGRDIATAAISAVRALPPIADPNGTLPKPGTETAPTGSLELLLLDFDEWSDTATQGSDLGISAVMLDGYPVHPPPQVVVEWRQPVRGWHVAVDLGQLLQPGRHVVRVEGRTSDERPLRYEWSFTVSE
ncbi:MAG TPA: hypothetical protein PLQ54_02615 [Armatimonadota bacterium]|nr:hypothetical protein [Armatimonadota bacterium]